MPGPSMPSRRTENEQRFERSLSSSNPSGTTISRRRQTSAVASALLFAWRQTVPWCLGSLTLGCYLSSRGSSPSQLLNKTASDVGWLWLESTSGLGAAVDGGLRKVFPQRWNLDQATAVVLGAIRGAAVAGFRFVLHGISRCHLAVVHWRTDVWEAYVHHTDALSVPAEQRGAPPRLTRRATFSGVVDRLEVTDRVPPAENVPR
ncbi:hypothetical protein IscW_ISCW018318 [Ixodes scapularis]|uniref:Uncharacterized protein n=1 Tax=Ixodes scapularis TaxID=6945 RepID=B7PGU7_IXOSC|nr:hypothetical protein IscW_ISCW018318 [Ixodes scapularis]|eukprot:XP_002401456.1 hypothetical protein IscW_ISCW018318 [Ixodes scapularis]